MLIQNIGAFLFLLSTLNITGNLKTKNNIFKEKISIATNQEGKCYHGYNGFEKCLKFLTENKLLLVSIYEWKKKLN